MIGSVWRRILAFAVDGAVLNISGRIVGIAFFAELSRSGPWARIFGFCIALAYFGALESRAGGGQTIGKRLLKLKVVDQGGRSLSWGRAAARYSVFAVPYFLLVGPKFSVETRSVIAGLLLIIVIFGFGFSTLYLLAFNRRTGQGLHDLLVGSYVVNSTFPGPLEVGPMRLAHWWAISGHGTFIVVFAFLVAIGGELNQKAGNVSQQSKDEQLIERLGRVRSADVMLWRPKRSGSGASVSHFLKDTPSKIIIQWFGEPRDREAVANQVAGIILQCDPRAHSEDLISIKIGRSYNLGIASGNDYDSFTHTPADWQQRVASSLWSCTP